MILKASQRGGGMQLGAHLLKAENEHVEVHEVRGFMANTVLGAMKEAQAVSKGTRCKQFLFSVSLNPPETESVPVEAFESAIEQIEHANGLTGQPRIVVFHEKEGRRHCHAVWSRIDSDTMTARPLPFFKMKLREISKDLYLEHGWRMPRGLMNSSERDPRNFTLAEWQQAKRMGRDPKQLKSIMQECWSVSDSSTAFAKALEMRGLYLAKGDRRWHVALTYEGEVLSVSRIIGKRTKEVTAKLGKADDLRNVIDTRSYIASVIVPKLGELIAVADKAKAREMAPLDARRITMKEQHATERQKLSDGQRNRAIAEAKLRSERLRHGVAGLWDRLTGQHSIIVKQNEAEAYQAFCRDRNQRSALIAAQMKDRQTLQREILAVRQRHAVRVLDLHHDLARQKEMQARSISETFGHSASPVRQPGQPRQSSRGQGRGKQRGPELGR